MLSIDLFRYVGMVRDHLTFEKWSVSVFCAVYADVKQNGCRYKICHSDSDSDTQYKLKPMPTCLISQSVLVRFYMKFGCFEENYA